MRQSLKDAMKSCGGNCNCEEPKGNGFILQVPKNSKVSKKQKALQRKRSTAMLKKADAWLLIGLYKVGKRKGNKQKGAMECIACHDPHMFRLIAEGVSRWMAQGLIASLKEGMNGGSGS